MTVDAWRRRRADAMRDTASRRATQVVPKPKAPAVPALTQVEPTPLTATAARDTYLAHRGRCAACTGRTHCADGGGLAVTFVRLLHAAPKHTRNRRLLEEVMADLEHAAARQFPRRRAAEWVAVLPAVQATDTRRRLRPAGTTPACGHEVPTESLRISV
ncbi:hypothetical protein OG216_46895 (plasmid) [Streptomycetaceae bacterium NBC_01309]